MDAATRDAAISSMVTWLTSTGVNTPADAQQAATILVDQAITDGAGGEPGNS